ncbi:MAG: class I mannose-6-phosphate isomerase [Bacteroidales bacterium]|nr:class I mannose-6-phosphate isomerase [Bacteroidales bacterium]
MWYPLKFEPILKEVIWGGERICAYKSLAGKGDGIGESWEISQVENHVSLVSEGPLRGRSLSELIAMDATGLLGARVRARFGDRFPLLVKFIDAKRDLSVQVHPDDAAARRHHGPSASGKTEMWYVLESETDSELVTGFSKDIDLEEYKQRIAEDSIEEVLHREHPAGGDVYFIPPGCVHAIGKGILLAEIQQSSDYTYRLYDYNRVDSDGRRRELHTDLAAEVLDYSRNTDSRIRYQRAVNQAVTLADCPYFTTNLLELNAEAGPEAVHRDLLALDSFVICICTEGSARLVCLAEGASGKKETVLRQGETVLIPARLADYCLLPQPKATILETYIG